MAKTPYKANPCLDLIEPMITSFLKREQFRQKAVLVDLIDQNHQAGGHAYGYYFNGKCFSLHGLTHLKGQPLNQVEPSLRQDAEDFDLARTKLANDEHKLTNSLTVVLSRCNSFQDVRDVLPEPLAQVFTQLSTLPRMQEEGWVLKESPMLRSQYEKAINIALYYQVNSLIF